MSKKNKPTFYEFLRKIYGIEPRDYYEKLNDNQKKAAELDYEYRYGLPIRWF